MQGGVGLLIAAAIETMASAVPGARLQGTHATDRRKRRI